MKVAGGIGCGAAIVLLLMAVLVGLSAVSLKSQVNAQTDFERTVNDWSGQGKKVDAQINGVAIVAGVLGAGAALCGLGGLVLLVIGFLVPPSGGQASMHRPPPREPYVLAEAVGEPPPVRDRNRSAG